MRSSRDGRAQVAAACAVALLALATCAAPACAADPAKTLRVVLTSAEMRFDPQFSADAGSDGIIDHIYDAMLDYDYLARPVKLGRGPSRRCRRSKTAARRTFSG